MRSELMESRTVQGPEDYVKVSEDVIHWRVLIIGMMLSGSSFISITLL